MNIEERIRISIGDLVIQLQAALAQIEALQAENEKLRGQSPDVSKWNGGREKERELNSTGL